MSEPFRCEPSDETWTMTDSDYRPVMIVQRGADVFIDLGTGSHTRRFDGAKRDIFSRCLFEAERRAEAHAEAVARATVPGQVPSRVKHGPWCDCTPCKAEPSYEGRRATVPGQESGG